MASPYIKAGLLTLAITLLGFFFITQLDSMRAGELRSSVDELMFQSESERMLFLYAQTMGNSTSELCAYVSKTTEAKAARAYELSQKIQYYEQSNIINSEYERIKSQYYLANAGLYLNMRATSKFCDSSPYTTVLFFYRVKLDCPECRAQGGVLDSLRKKHPNLRVFAFPNDTELPFINVFIKRHGIEKVPALVIDDSVVLQGLKSEEEIEEYLAAEG